MQNGRCFSFAPYSAVPRRTNIYFTPNNFPSLSLQDKPKFNMITRMDPEIPSIILNGLHFFWGDTLYVTTYFAAC